MPDLSPPHQSSTLPPVDVLDRQLPGTTKTGRFWVYLGDKDHPQNVLAYTPSRSRDGPMKFLAGWGRFNRVYLQADAFGGYDGIYAGEAGGNVTEVACLAHYPEFTIIRSWQGRGPRMRGTATFHSR